MELHNKKVLLVTGSTHGIGKAIVSELAKLDYSVVINGATTKNLDEEYYSELKGIYDQDIDNRFLYVQADIGKKEDRDTLIKKIEEKFGRIDVLVNNAGVAPIVRNDILETTEESYDRVMSINLKGPYFLTQSISKWMIRLKANLEDSYQPYIINISSINRYTASINRGEYCISKSGMSMMTKLFGERLADYGIFVYEISPGIIDTPMTERIHESYDKQIKEGLTPIRRWGKPIDIAKPVVAIVSGLLPFSTGSVIDIDGGFHLHRL
ncbi:MAG: 3-ketoacyl-ACP reductase [Promethearchaeota archaeon]|jgi:NAD(P)-dependent dehydrogenase (short-subunit alcohol dehydrogenase family)